MQFQVPAVLQRDNLSPAQRDAVETLARGKANAVARLRESESAGAIAARGFVGNLISAAAGGVDRVAPRVPIGNANVPASGALAIAGIVGGFFFDSPMIAEASWWMLAPHSYVAGMQGADRLVVKWTSK